MFLFALALKQCINYLYYISWAASVFLFKPSSCAAVSLLLLNPAVLPPLPLWHFAIYMFISLCLPCQILWICPQRERQ